MWRHLWTNTRTNADLIIFVYIIMYNIKAIQKINYEW